MSDPRLPVTIITGFLGAGKTTLLNHLIKKHPDKRFAIIENEFGDIGIDGALIVEGSDSIFELSNGCICCTLNNDLNDTLTKLMAMGERINHILVETTGIADPLTVVQSFLTGEAVQRYFRIDSVVCLVDAEHLADLMESEPEVRNQLAMSDVVLLNKTDRVHADYLATLRKTISQMSPMATLHETTFADVSHIDIIDTNAYGGRQVGTTVLRFDATHRPLVVSNVMAPAFEKKAHTHRHDITSEGFEFAGSFDIQRFNAWIQGFLYFNSNTVYRVKGLVSFAGYDQLFVFHAVRGTFMLEKYEGNFPGGEICKMVFIGKFLDRELLQNSLEQLLDGPMPG